MTTAAPAPGRLTGVLALVAVAAASVAGWEVLKGASERLAPSHRLNITITNSTDRRIAAVLIDPQGGRRSLAQEVGPRASVKWRPALVGDGLPLKSDPLYQLMVLDDRNEIVWREGYVFLDVYRVESIELTADAGGQKARVAMRPKREGKTP